MTEPAHSAPVSSQSQPQDRQQSPVPAIRVPRGGGAIRGIGEKFAANPVTGTGAMTVPIATSPGRSGFGRQLDLSDDSGAGYGPFGFGWQLSLPGITRETDNGLPRYRDAIESDGFVVSGAEDLVPVLGPGDVPADADIEVDGKAYTVRRYRARIEGLHARIERWTRQRAGDVHWRSYSRDNVLTLYGLDVASRIFDPDDPTRVFEWLICESRGNAMLYSYQAGDNPSIEVRALHERNRGARSANRYLKRIIYGNRRPLLDAVRDRRSCRTRCSPLRPREARTWRRGSEHSR